MYSKQLQDLVKITRQGQVDNNSFLNECLQEIRYELKDGNEDNKLSALMKLFFLHMEGFDLRWADFTVLNCMGSEKLQLKRIAYSVSHLIFESESKCMIMTINVFKKEMTKSYFIETSMALNCITNCVTPEIGSAIIEDAVKLQAYSQASIRKKSCALIGKIFYQNPDLIPQYIDKILNRLAKDENNPAVLASALQIISHILNKVPSLYPVFIKPLYEILEKQKTNWFLIKLVRLFNKLIKFESRLVKKLIEPFDKLLNNCKSKSLEYELVLIIIRYFKDQKDLYIKAQDKLKIFIQSSDPNLKSLGLICLKSMLENDVSIMSDYKLYLMESFKKSDFSIKLQILDILYNYIYCEIFDEIAQFIVDNMKTLHQRVKENCVEFLAKIIEKDQYKHLNDPEWVVVHLIPIMCQQTESIENAQRISQLIYNLITRIIELREPILQVAIKILVDFDFQANKLSISNQRLNSLPEDLIKQNQISNLNQLSGHEIIFQTMVFIVGENSKLFKMKEKIIQVMDYFNDEIILQKYQHITKEISSATFKLLLNLANFYKENQNIQEFHYQIYNYFQINKILLRNDYQGSDIFMILISNSLELNIDLIFSVQNRTQFLEIIGEKNVYEQILSLQYLIKEELPPISKDAQKSIKYPKNFEIDGDIIINQEEIKLIQNMMKDFEEKPQQNLLVSQPKDVKIESQNKVQGEEIQQQLSQQEEPKRPKKQFIVQEEQELPNTE